jgi:hypothetical protein
MEDDSVSLTQKVSVLGVDAFVSAGGKVPDELSDVISVEEWSPVEDKRNAPLKLSYNVYRGRLGEVFGFEEFDCGFL